MKHSEMYITTSNTYLIVSRSTVLKKENENYLFLFFFNFCFTFKQWIALYLIS